VRGDKGRGKGIRGGEEGKGGAGKGKARGWLAPKVTSWIHLCRPKYESR